MFCTQCGKPLNNDDRFCKYCGASVLDNPNTQSNVVNNNKEVSKEMHTPSHTRLNTLYYLSNLLPTLIFFCSFGLGAITNPPLNIIGISFLVVFCILTFAYLKITRYLLDLRTEVGWEIPTPQLLKFNSKFINIVFLAIGVVGFISAHGNYSMGYTLSRAMGTVVSGISLLVVRCLFNRYVKKYI